MRCSNKNDNARSKFFDTSHVQSYSPTPCIQKSRLERRARTGMAIHPLVAASCEDKGKIYSFIDKPERVTSTILKMLYKIKK
jgi:hypothetical protein